MYVLDDEDVLQDAVISETSKLMRVRDDDNRFHLGELSQMAQKMGYDEQTAMAQMFDTKVLFEVLQERFNQLELVINQVKHVFEER